MTEQSPPIQPVAEVRAIRGVRQRRSGQGAVEFGLSIIVLMILAMGTVDFALAFFAQETIQQAATTGARRAAVCQVRDTTHNPPTDTTSIDYAINSALFNQAWSSVTVAVAYENGSATVGRQVTVTLTYTFGTVTPLVGDIIKGALGSSPTVTGKGTSTVEQASTSC
jgi:Flp pilus assembly protein TadG